MAKTEVYSWRLSTETKSTLEETARQNQSSVSELLNQIVDEWLASQKMLDADEGKQQRLHDSALKTIGTIQGNDPDRASNAKMLVRKKLVRQLAN